MNDEYKAKPESPVELNTESNVSESVPPANASIYTQPATLPPSLRSDTSSPKVPPVGLNWHIVANRLRIDEAILRKDGVLVLSGEYFPTGGYAIDPASFHCYNVQGNERALTPMYFIGKLTADEFRLRLRIEGRIARVPHQSILQDRGPIIGLFSDPAGATRAKRDIHQGSLGGPVLIVTGPLGQELRVQKTHMSGRVATVIAAEGGAVISISGTPLRLA